MFFTTNEKKTNPKSNIKNKYFCMPLLRNVPVGHPDWKMMICPKCGARCWKSPQMEALVAAGFEGLCKMCAIKEGIDSG